MHCFIESIHKTSLYLEEDGVILQELGQVGIPQSSDEHYILVLVWVLSLQCTSHHQHRFERTHAEIVVILEKKKYVI